MKNTITMHVNTETKKSEHVASKSGKGLEALSPKSQGRNDSPSSRKRSRKGQSPGGTGQAQEQREEGTYCTLCDGTELVMRICEVCSMCFDCFGDDEIKEMTASNEPGICFLCEERELLNGNVTADNLDDLFEALQEKEREIAEKAAAALEVVSIPQTTTVLVRRNAIIASGSSNGTNSGSALLASSSAKGLDLNSLRFNRDDLRAVYARYPLAKPNTLPEEVPPCIMSSIAPPLQTAESVLHISKTNAGKVKGLVESKSREFQGSALAPPKNHSVDRISLVSWRRIQQSPIRKILLADLPCKKLSRKTILQEIANVFLFRFQQNDSNSRQSLGSTGPPSTPSLEIDPLADTLITYCRIQHAARSAADEHMQAILSAMTRITAGKGASGARLQTFAWLIGTGNGDLYSPLATSIFNSLLLGLFETDNQLRTALAQGIAQGTSWIQARKAHDAMAFLFRSNPYWMFKHTSGICLQYGLPQKRAEELKETFREKVEAMCVTSAGKQLPKFVQGSPFVVDMDEFINGILLYWMMEQRRLCGELDAIERKANVLRIREVEKRESLWHRACARPFTQAETDRLLDWGEQVKRTGREILVDMGKPETHAFWEAVIREEGLLNRTAKPTCEHWQASQAEYEKSQAIKWNYENWEWNEEWDWGGLVVDFGEEDAEVDSESDPEDISEESDDEEEEEEVDIVANRRSRGGGEEGMKANRDSFSNHKRLSRKEYEKSQMKQARRTSTRGYSSRREKNVNHCSLLESASLVVQTIDTNRANRFSSLSLSDDSIENLRIQSAHIDIKLLPPMDHPWVSKRQGRLGSLRTGHGFGMAHVLLGEGRPSQIHQLAKKGVRCAREEKRNKDRVGEKLGVIVDLRHNGIGHGDLDADVLVKSLEDGNVPINILALGENQMTDKTCAAMVRSLRATHEIKHLDISANKIGNNTCDALVQFLTPKANLSPVKPNNRALSAIVPAMQGMPTNPASSKSTKSTRTIQTSVTASRSPNVFPEGLVRANTEKLDKNKKDFNSRSAVTSAKRISEPEPSLLVAPILASLVNLNISSASLVDHQLIPIIKALKSHQNITRLNLSHNELGRDEALAKQLRALVSTEESPLQHLLLGWNNFNESTGTILLSGLTAQNRSLRSIGLQFNNIGDPGAAKAAKVMSNTQNLQHVDLSFNCITQDSARVLASALKNNIGLKWLGLEGNGFGAEGSKIIFKGAKVPIKDGRLIVILGLDYTDVDDNTGRRKWIEE